MIDQLYFLQQRKKQLQMRQQKYNEPCNHDKNSPCRREPKAEPVDTVVDYKNIFKVPKLDNNVLDYSPFNFY